MSLIMWNFNSKLNDIILSNNNLTAKKGNVKLYEGIKTTEGKLKGKYYFEISVDEMIKDYTNSDIIIGICNNKQIMQGFIGKAGFTNFFGYYDFGSKVSYGDYIKYGDAYDKGDVISVLLNLDDKNIEFWKNGISQGVAFNNLDNVEWYPCVFAWTNFQWTANFGASQFKYKIPKGYMSYDETQVNINKFLIKQNNNYFSIKSNFYPLGQPKDSVQLQNWHSKCGANNINIITQILNNKEIPMTKDENDIWKTDFELDANEITDSIDMINTDENSKSIKYDCDKYRILDRIKEIDNGEFEVLMKEIS